MKVSEMNKRQIEQNIEIFEGCISDISNELLNSTVNTNEAARAFQRRIEQVIVEEFGNASTQHNEFDLIPFVPHMTMRGDVLASVLGAQESFDTQCFTTSLNSTTELLKKFIASLKAEISYQTAMKYCPKCNRQYLGQEYCSNDGSLLVDTDNLDEAVTVEIR